MNDLDMPRTPSALAVVSLMVLAAGISYATLLRAERPAKETPTFVGTAPDAPTGEIQPPTF
jgi:hypothetical protein